MTNLILWPSYEAGVADQRPGQVGGANFEAVSAFGMPAINTLILLTSASP